MRHNNHCITLAAYSEADKNPLHANDIYVMISRIYIFKLAKLFMPCNYLLLLHVHFQLFVQHTF